MLTLGLLLGQAALADPPGGRLPPDERERLRQELRQQRFEESQRARQRDERLQVPRQGGAAPGDRGANPGTWRGAYPDNRDYGQQRMSPEERRQLRMLLRERHREDRGQSRD